MIGSDSRNQLARGSNSVNGSTSILNFS